MKLISAGQMQNADRCAIDRLGIPGAVLMENAGRAATEVISSDYRQLFPGPVLVLAGKGNNGGDGYVIARGLLERGWQVKTLVLADHDAIVGDAGLMLSILQNIEASADFVTAPQELAAVVSDYAPRLLIDALLGTGLTSSVHGLYAEAIDLLNASGAPVVAVDIPSGVDGSTGRVMGGAVEAALTVTFDSAKIGHVVWPGGRYTGRLSVVEIGIPQRCHDENHPPCHLLDGAEARNLLPDRPKNGHKGRFGHLLVVAGSPGKTGAAALAAEAGIRSGSGLVTAACPAAVHDILEVKLTEAMTLPLADTDGLLNENGTDLLLELLPGFQSLVLGPGLGVGSGLGGCVRRIIANSSIPMVVDADALNALAGETDTLLRIRCDQMVLTPHPGEMARLTGLTIAEIEADRFRVARDFAVTYGVVLILKGAASVIAAPDGRVNINGSGNVGLASGGSGDVLAGLIGGLLAQGLDVFDAASLGCYLHGLAADRIAAGQGTAGMKAGDLLAELPAARSQLFQGDEYAYR
ncbi:MAG: bifunctional ADP-dependent NAD(P)H-hydrate dehydratase/NAD(P)H-hydrate epimerase [Desulfuromonas sp.]|nr:MAG: bifunctional ADP-dependent NAD(P)H-hydrate dehydratase/NAD(P)H-hydrate epimerase [Desulfuromonas sp.]